MGGANSKISRRLGVLAAVLASVAIPGAAMAEPGGRGWRGADNGDSPRPVRGERGDGGTNPERSWQQAAPPPQAEAPRPRGSGWAPPPQPRPTVGWSSAVAPPESQPDSQRHRGQPDAQGQGGWTGVQQPQTWRGRGWADADDGDDDRARHKDPHDQHQGYYLGGYYHGETGGERRWTQQQRWDRRWHHDDRYDWRSYRSAHPGYYRAGAYYAPYRSYSYRRISIGFVLDSLFFGSRYRISDPWRYRLPDVYGPYRWVRYYDDAVLVDVYSGEVVDVIYSFFW